VLETAGFREMLDRVAVVPLVGRDDWNAEVRILMTDGSEARAAGTLDGGAGDVAPELLRQKFHSLAEPVIGPEHAERLEALVMRLETVPDVSEVAALCIAGGWGCD
jgi:hypothetical protein